MKKLVIFSFLITSISFSQSQDNSSPNVLWIYVDDMSDWLGCYGDNTVPTPNIDMLAEFGVRFNRAYMPAPVCSATRSALITGTMQTTYGLQDHRTMIKKPLPEEVISVPELFREAGYVTFNEEKTDYNFSYNYNDLFSPEFQRPAKTAVNGHLVGHDLSWLEQLKGKKFFGQIQLSGGKYEGETGSKYPANSRVEENKVTVPPQYPDNAVFRNAIARHYEQIAFCDSQVGAIIQALKEYNLWENTAVFFFTDHGCPLPRAKQHLYEEGVKVPLIVYWPDNNEYLLKAGKERDDIVSGIDISTSSLAIAGIEIPEFMEGKDLFAKNYGERDFVVSAKDRQGNAIDHARAIRTDNYIYIRNYMTDRPLFQPAYRDSYATFVNLRELYAEGELTPLQESFFEASDRSDEELYNIKNDPHQMNNLADKNGYKKLLKKYRRNLREWEMKTDDKGRYPDDIEELRKVYENAPERCVNPEYAVFREKH